MKTILLKLSMFILLFVIICCMAGIYSFLQDQIGYTVLPEYFTQLKFHQFNIPNSLHNRIGTSIVGIKATWRMGLLIGIIIIPIGLIIPNWKNYLKIVLRAFVHITITLLITGITALIYGLITYNINNLPCFNIPEGFENKVKFCVVGNMHNFSYIGGIVGMIVGLIDLFKNHLDPPVIVYDTTNQSHSKRMTIVAMSTVRICHASKCFYLVIDLFNDNTSARQSSCYMPFPPRSVGGSYFSLWE